MAKYLLRGNYSPEGFRGLSKDGGTGRAEIVRALIENSGGRVDGMYFALDEFDAYVLCDLPDQVTAAGLAIAIRASGGPDTRITRLLMPEEVDQAVQMTVMYQPPTS